MQSTLGADVFPPEGLELDTKGLYLSLLVNYFRSRGGTNQSAGLQMASPWAGRSRGPGGPRYLGCDHLEGKPKEGGHRLSGWS